MCPSFEHFCNNIITYIYTIMYITFRWCIIMVNILPETKVRLSLLLKVIHTRPMIYHKEGQASTPQY